jgi:hypothetical protein
MATVTHTQPVEETQILTSAGESVRLQAEAKLLARIVAEYRPYDTMDAFGEGFGAGQRRVYVNPYAPSTRQVTTARDALNAQAWDRGCEAAGRYARALDPRTAPWSGRGIYYGPAKPARPAPQPSSRDPEVILAEIAAAVEASTRD